MFIAVTDNKDAIKRFKESNNFNFPIYTINWKDVRSLSSFVPAIFIINNKSKYIEWHSIGGNETFIQDIKNFFDSKSQ